MSDGVIMMVSCWRWRDTTARDVGVDGDGVDGDERQMMTADEVYGTKGALLSQQTCSSVERRGHVRKGKGRTATATADAEPTVVEVENQASTARRRHRKHVPRPPGLWAFYILDAISYKHDD
ncbi:hypothetical protein M422DRAFT_255169 [Sphaerobolus stellatus SS14]|uniref:Uncharacterized protein n=1 Tax=Sphaerobolus stellatus (strain SS14) TaxID=990650 RepID=A0A0C9UFR8_SPHS4|nr:hypothetical protein M422DRAFT_255168 [Sphaerobolus stellatus SS14]KIJ41844.1 hypothetical protein M422DRAFT_255169 [Sphaerobolus stellatus SS14]